MDVPSITAIPTPWWLFALIPLLPPIWFLSRYLSRGAGLSPAHDFVVSLGVFVFTWLTTVHLVSLWLSDFYQGLVISTLALAAGGAVLLVKLDAAQRRQLLKVAGPLTTRETLVLVGLVLLLVPSFYIGEFWDRKFFFSHHALVSQVLNGVYPPRDPMFASEVLTYHFGIDTLYAMFVALTHGRQDIVMDLVSLGLWAYYLAMLALLGRALFGGNGGIWTMLLGGLAGGLRLLGDAPDAKFLWQKYLFTQDAFVGDVLVNHPFVSYVFQSPFILGTAAAFLVLLLATYTQQHGFTRGRGQVLFLTVVAMPFSNIALFLTVVASILGGALVLWLWQRQRRFLYLMLVVLAAAMLFPFTSNVLEAGDQELRSKTELLGLARYGIAGSADNSAGWNILLDLSWNLVTFGLLLPLGVYGLVRHHRRSLWMVFLFCGSFVVLNAIAYRGLWDMVKFATVAALVLAVFTAPVLQQMWERPRLRLPVAGLLLVLSWDALGLVATSGWLRLPAQGSLSKDGYYSWMWHSISDDDKRAIAWLRTRVGPGELVLRTPDNKLCPDGPGEDCFLHKAYGLIGGLPQPWPRHYALGSGFSEQAIARRDGLAEALPDEPGPWMTEGVRWAVEEVGDAAWFGRARVKEHVRFGTLRIVELLR